VSDTGVILGSTRVTLYDQLCDRWSRSTVVMMLLLGIGCSTLAVFNFSLSLPSGFPIVGLLVSAIPAGLIMGFVLLVFLSLLTLIRTLLLSEGRRHVAYRLDSENFTIEDRTAARFSNAADLPRIRSLVTEQLGRSAKLRKR
jgi:hypothetical protein